MRVRLWRNKRYNPLTRETFYQEGLTLRFRNFEELVELMFGRVNISPYEHEQMLKRLLSLTADGFVKIRVGINTEGNAHERWFDIHRGRIMWRVSKRFSYTTQNLQADSSDDNGS